MVAEVTPSHDSQGVAINAVAQKLGGVSDAHRHQRHGRVQLSR
jgi:hypothetical protein